MSRKTTMVNCTEYSHVAGLNPYGLCACGQTSLGPSYTSLSYTPAATQLRSLEGGRKDDAEKPPLELLPSAALLEVAKVLGHGRKKYDAYNWTKGMNWSRLLGAAMRHLFAYNSGEDKDPESKLSHLAHLACCALFLLEYEQRKLGTDDRHKWEAK